MRKKIISVCLIMVFFIFLCSGFENRKYIGRFNSISFSNGIAQIYVLDLKTIVPSIIRADYQIREEEDIPFLYLGDPVNQKWLFLHSETFAVIFKDSTEALFDITGHSRGFDNLRNGDYLSTSYLKEGETHYSPDNLGNSSPDKPWVEGVNGFGEGEELSISWQTWREQDGSRGGVGALIISNGFVSYEKPYLYRKNNRVKELEVIDGEGAFSFIFKMEDTPNPQVIFLPTAPKTIKLRIVSVYPGTNWDDTCINFIKGLEMRQAQLLKQRLSPQ